jgi:hypothetical protein
MQRRDDQLETFAMRQTFPQFRRTGSRWLATIQPRPGGMAFKVEIDTAWIPPRVRILEPVLVNEPGQPVPPHHFVRERAACLFHDSDEGWDASKPMALTIVPWIFEWCYFYELWLDTGRWYGPEYDHGQPKVEARGTAPSSDAAA